MPEREGSTHDSSLRESLAGVGQIFRARDFWRFAPQAALFTGAFMALQGLWVVPWLMNVNGYSRDVAADHLFAIGIGMMAGQLGTAALLAHARGSLLTPYKTMWIGLALLVWALWSLAAATGSQMYGVVAGFFPGKLAGRATTAINLMAFIGAFALQWGLGAAIDHLRGQGLSAVDAYRMSFAALLALQVAAYVWMRRGGEPGTPR